MYILGLSCFYHDSAAALIKDRGVKEKTNFQSRLTACLDLLFF